MPRRKNKTMKGGFWDTITDMFKKKPATQASTTTPSSSYTPSTTTPVTRSTTSTIPSSSTSYTPSSSTTLMSRGGRRTRRRGYKGGYAPNHSLTNLASKASPFSGSKTAQPQVWLGGPHMKGGKSRKLKKSRRNRRH
jgi:hypothetical protein